MADEEIKQPAETAVAGNDYEYEYIELAEGEELPEGVEYEYEYVEVPAEAEAEDTAVAEGRSEAPNMEPEEALPVTMPVEAPVVAEDEKEPQFEIQMPAEPVVEDDLPSLASTEKETSEPINADDFLKLDQDELSLDEILDDNSPAEAEIDMELEKQLYGTPEPVLTQLPEDVEYRENVAAEIVEDLPAGPEAIEAVSDEEKFVSAEMNEVPQETAYEPVEEEVEPDAAAPDMPPVEDYMEEPEHTGIAENETELVSEIIVPEEESAALDPEDPIVPVDESLPYELISEEVVAAPEDMNEAAQTEMPVEVSENQTLETVVSENKLIAEEVLADVVAAPEEQVVQVESEPEIIESTQEGEISVISGLQENSSGLETVDFSEAEPVEAQVEAEIEPEDDVYIQGLVEEETLPPLVVKAEKQIEADDGAFHQTEELPAAFSCRIYESEEFPLLQAAARTFSKQGAMQNFQADDGLKYILLDDLDFATHELENWSLIIFDDYRLRLNPADPALSIAKNVDTVRYAKVIKGGKTKLELFNEQEYNFVAPHDDFVKVRGNYIYGNIGNNSKLIVKDFININLVDKAGQFISFNKPSAGVLVGPKAAKLYFCDVQGVIVPADREIRADKSREESRAARWYSGSLRDKYFEYGANMDSAEFAGTQELKSIHVNVGTSSYGWNVAFDNGLFMSFRDLQEYQTKYGQLPSPNGVITHGTQSLKFSNVEKIVVYEVAQYFSYGRV